MVQVTNPLALEMGSTAAGTVTGEDLTVAVLNLFKTSETQSVSAWVFLFRRGGEFAAVLS